MIRHEILPGKLINLDLLALEASALPDVPHSVNWIKIEGQRLIRFAFYDGATTTLGDCEALIVAHDGSAQTPTAANRDFLVGLAMSAAGVEITALTDAQRWALLGVLLYKAGAIDMETLTIKPLGQWAR
jgi:hypothetical protein